MVNRQLKYLITPYFILSLLGYLFVRLSRLGLYSIPTFLNNYLTDFLCMPIVLTLSLIGVRLIKRDPTISLTPTMIYGMTAFYAILFEWILPHQHAKYTQDPIDVIMYFIGGIFFAYIQQKQYLTKYH